MAIAYATPSVLGLLVVYCRCGHVFVRTKTVMSARRFHIFQENSNTTLHTIITSHKSQVAVRNVPAGIAAMFHSEGLVITPYMVFAAESKCL